MIWSLAREQVRSQRRYLIAAAVVIAVTVGIASYGALMTLTLVHSQGEIDHFMGYDRETVADASTSQGYMFDELAPNIDAANTDGHEVVAVANVWLTLPTDGSEAYSELVALYGDVDWTTILVDGSAPGPGEIAVNAQWASKHGVAVGDNLDPATGDTDGLGNDELAPPALTVSGLTRSAVSTAAVQLYVPGGFVGWDDVPALNQAAYDSANSQTANEAAYEAPVGVTISGNGEWPWSAELATSAMPYGYSNNPAAAIAIIAGIGAAAMVVGLVAMAFALGRAQAQGRTKWLGTVRALGATKRQVAAASLLESAIVGIAAGLGGLILGVVATASHMAVISARVAHPMMSRAPAGYLAVGVGALLLAVVLALIVGSVPAFWAARVEPTAALKPVNDMSEATASRSVKTWPLAAAWFASLAVSAYGAIVGVGGLAIFPVAIGAVTFVVTSLMLAHEVLRRSLPWHARRMSRSARKPVMVAGDAIQARPRQSTIPAFITAVATCVTAVILLPLVAQWAVMDAISQAEGASAFPNAYIAPLPLMGVYVVVMVLCVAIAVATASVTGREAATREALGVTPREGRGAAAIQYLVAQVHGFVLGFVGVALAGGFAFAYGTEDPWGTVGDWAGPVLQEVGLIALIAACFACLGAAIAASLAPKTAPLSRVEVSA